ncbi:MAG: DUF1844 domain-containing protein [Acidobacteriales bacterium]|nr:DUF1844 domain-containing protein [Terriglobales bacterium]
MSESKKSEFVVEDRRRFTAEGELSDTVTEEKAAPEAAVAAAAEPPPAVEEKDAEVPLPPTAEQQHAQRGEYVTASKKIDDLLDAAGAKRPPNLEVTFETLVASIYMQAMMQLGMIREEGVPPRPDIIGARHSIDTLSLLHEKTKGNLNERESHMLQNALFELRMAFLEITNVLTTQPPPGAPTIK